MRLFLDAVPSPIGTLSIVTDETLLRGLYFGGADERLLKSLRRHYGSIELLERRERLGVRQGLEAYFAGELRALETLPSRSNGTPFQESVWAALRKIPAGTTTTYGSLAAGLGNVAATRAVGLANGSNPLPLVVPCHRVIGADGSLTGFGGGLWRKAWLLRHEGVAVPGSGADARDERLSLFDEPLPAPALSGR